jgi:hypothetical protein
MQPFNRAMLQGATAAPQAAQTVAAAAAPKPRTPAPARPAGGAPAPARKEAPAAPAGQVGKANEDLLAQVRGEQDAARQARYGGLVEKEIPNAAGTPVKQLRFAENEDPTDFYKRKLADVMRLRAERQLGPGGSARGIALDPEAIARGGVADSEFVRGVTPYETNPLGRSEPITFMPQATGKLPGMALRSTVEVPMGGKGGALDSVADFRRRAEAQGLRYRAAQQAMDAGAREIENVTAETRVSEMPAKAAAQRQRTQEFVNARGALEQLGFTDEEMKQKFGY